MAYVLAALGKCLRATCMKADMAVAALEWLTVFQQDHLMKPPQIMVCEKYAQWLPRTYAFGITKKVLSTCQGKHT